VVVVRAENRRIAAPYNEDVASWRENRNVEERVKTSRVKTSRVANHIK
jgi:hypothetical protein